MSDRGETNGHRPTIRDVAEQAGVSKSLVSLVLRGEPNVREDKRRRVQQVADELGYRMNLAARSLSNVRSKTVGVLVPTCGTRRWSTWWTGPGRCSRTRASARC
jgi:DNA-binding LacI/PurR family transcriptional regulator